MVSKEDSQRVVSEYSDEIDLIELMTTLWRGKWLVVCIIFSCVILTLTYLWITPKVYKIEFPIYPVEENELRALAISDTGKVAEVVVSKLSRQKLFRVCLDKLESINELKGFWLSHPTLLENDSDGVLSGLIEFKERFQVVRKKENNDGNVSIQFEGEDPEGMAEKIEGLLLYVSASSLQSSLKPYLKAMDVSVQRIDESIVRARQEAQADISDRILIVSEAREVSTALGIKDSEFSNLANIEVDLFEGRLYLLGSKALDAELKALEKRKGNDAFVSRLRDLQTAKEVLINDRVRIFREVEKVKAFDYPDKIGVPLTQELKPAFILVLSVLLGGLVGSVIVFIRQAVRNHNARGSDEKTSSNLQ